jgi:tyrosyl-DNA phosphodiesterase-1
MENVCILSPHPSLILITAQSVWLQDIPLRSKPIDGRKVTDDFPAILQYVLHSVNVRPALAAMISDNVATLAPSA